MVINGGQEILAGVREKGVGFWQSCVLQLDMIRLQRLSPIIQYEWHETDKHTESFFDVLDEICCSLVFHYFFPQYPNDTIVKRGRVQSWSRLGARSLSFYQVRYVQQGREKHWTRNNFTLHWISNNFTHLGYISAYDVF